MAEPPRSPSAAGRIDPRPAWTVVTDAPLRGLSMAREAGLVLAWDEGDHLYLLGPDGERRQDARAPGKVATGAISDDGSIIALVGDRGRLWLLGPGLEPGVERPSLSEPLALAIDPHGRFIAVASRHRNQTQLFSRAGKLVDTFETRQPLSHLVSSRPCLSCWGRHPSGPSRGLTSSRTARAWCGARSPGRRR